MIKIVIEDEDGEKHYIEANKLLAGVMVEAPSAMYKPVQVRAFSVTKASDTMSLVSAQLIFLVGQLVELGITAEKIAELMAVLFNDSVKAALEQSKRQTEYLKERKNEKDRQ